MTAYSAAMQVVHNEADADDIAQETMVKLYLNIDALDEDRVEGWVRVAAKNLGIDYQRKAQRFDWNELDEDLRAEEMELPTLAEEEKQERNHFFREVMDALKDHDESGYYITREIKVHERSEKEVASGALAKPNILIPLSANASRGDQILNARSFERQGYSKVLEEESVNAQTLQSAIREVYENRQTYINAMKKSSHTDSIGRILSLIQECERK